MRKGSETFYNSNIKWQADFESLTCSIAVARYTDIKMGVSVVCPLFIRWMV